MVRYHGVLSSHAKARSEVVPYPDIATTPGRVVQLELFGDNESTDSEPRRCVFTAPECHEKRVATPSPSLGRRPSASATRSGWTLGGARLTPTAVFQLRNPYSL